MGVYQRGENFYIDFRFKGQRVRESIGPSKSAGSLAGRRRFRPIERVMKNADFVGP